MKARETAPERIWLQCISPNRFDWTWHSEPIGEDELEEVEYVRADLTEPGEPFHLTSERIAPDAVEDVEAVLRTAEWIRDEADEDPEQIAKITRGVAMVRGWLKALLSEPGDDSEPGEGKNEYRPIRSTHGLGDS
jgi:hypothetical protein